MPVATGNVPSEKRGPLVFGTSAKRVPLSHKSWLHGAPGCPGHGQGRGRTRGCSNATLSAERSSYSQGLIWDGMGAGVAMPPHIPS